MALLRNPYTGDNPDDEYPRGIEYSDWLWDGPVEIPCPCCSVTKPDPDCLACDGSGWAPIKADYR